MIKGERTRHTILTVLACCCGYVMITAVGCVMQSTYDAALQEGMTSRSELARAKEEQKVLARQVTELELQNADVVREAEAATSALQQAKDDGERERRQSAQEIAKLQQKAVYATKQQRSLRYELTVAKENSTALQEIIDGYQNKIRDGAVGAGPSSTAEPAVHKPFDPSTIPVPQDLPAAPAVAAPNPVQAPPPTPAPAPSASPAKRSQPPEEEGWISSVTGWLMSLWRSIFS